MRRVFRTHKNLQERPGVQIGAQVHVLVDNQLWQWINHSYATNCHIDFRTWTCVTTRAIQRDEELTFNYLTTEWDMAEPFVCRCGAATCYGFIAGFRYLAPAWHGSLAPHGAPHLLRLWREQALSTDYAQLVVWQPDVHVFVPYTTVDGRLESSLYDTPAHRAEVQSWFEALHLPWLWIPVTVKHLRPTIAAARSPGRTAPSVVFNLCDGDEIHGYPGSSVVRALEEAGVPFTGAAAAFFDGTTYKVPMKEGLLQHGVSTPPFVHLSTLPEDSDRLTAEVGYPAMIKPDVSAASLGISLTSCVQDAASASAQFSRLIHGERGARFLASEIFGERFIEGPEFPVLMAADRQCRGNVRVYPAVECMFHSALPPHERSLSDDRYWASYQEEARLPDPEPFYCYATAAPQLQEPLADLATRAFRALDGTGYARVDIRMETRTGILYGLEVNAHYDPSSDEETSVRQLVRLAQMPIHQLMAAILADALARFQAARRPWGSGQ